MANFPKYAGNAPILESGVAIFADDDPPFTINIRDLRFSITSWHDQSKPPITTEMLEQNHILITINTWRGGDLSFALKVGTLLGRDLKLAVNLHAHDGYRIVTYTFSQPISRSSETALIAPSVLMPDTDEIKVDDREVAKLNEFCTN